MEAVVVLAELFRLALGILAVPAVAVGHMEVIAIIRALEGWGLEQEDILPLEEMVQPVGRAVLSQVQAVEVLEYWAGLLEEAGQQIIILPVLVVVGVVRGVLDFTVVTRKTAQQVEHTEVEAGAEKERTVAGQAALNTIILVRVELVRAGPLGLYGGTVAPSQIQTQAMFNNTRL